MTILSLADKKALILDNENSMARQLAVRVVDKPEPPIWMIFMPIFFVFFAPKVKEYKKGLKTFAEHYQISRSWALEAAMEAVAHDHGLDVDAVLQRLEGIPEAAQAPYRAWLLLLAEHYRRLLVGRGETYPALVRSAYHAESSYLLFCDSLGKAENILNTAMLPGVEGERPDVESVMDKMAGTIAKLRRQEAVAIFGVGDENPASNTGGLRG